MKAVAKLIALMDADKLHDPRWQDGRAAWRAKDIKLLPDAKVLVDHDDAQPIGRVRELSTMGWADGRTVTRWVVAHLDLDDPAPAWIRRHTKVSIGFFDINIGQPVVGPGLIREVSILTPARKPAEPLAEVVLLEPNSLPAPVEKAYSNPPTPKAGEDFIVDGPMIEEAKRNQRPRHELDAMYNVWLRQVEAAA